MTARYICFEGLEGTGKTTQCQLLAEYLRSKGYEVLLTKEPGTPLAPITMNLRGLMLDQQYDQQLTPLAREMISQSIRSIHMEKIVYPALETHDFIIQDRGLLSGLSYGQACGNDPQWLMDMAKRVCSLQQHQSLRGVYSDVVVLRGNIDLGLERALTAKQEFASGDAIESKGSSFLGTVAKNMDMWLDYFSAAEIDINGHDINQVHGQIKSVLNL